jgi:hypothetical protein
MESSVNLGFSKVKTSEARNGKSFFWRFGVWLKWSSAYLTIIRLKERFYDDY